MQLRRRGGAATLLRCVAGCLGVCCLFTVANSSLIRHTLDNSRAIDAEFDRAAKFIEEYRQVHSRAPDSEEFDAQFPKGRWHVWLSDGLYTEDIAREFGPQPAGEYSLSIWRGEWAEHYAGWRQASTVRKSEADYYWLGSLWADAGAMSLGAALFVVAASIVGRADANAAPTVAGHATSLPSRHS